MKLGAAALALAACQGAAGPTVEQVSPPAAARGASVQVIGEAFCGEGRAGGDGQCVSLPPGSVAFGLDLPLARAQVLAWADTAISVVVPAAAELGAVDVVVTVDGRSSNAGAFEVLP